jgi:hypothetical protein
VSDTSLVPLPNDTAALDCSDDPADFLLLALDRAKGWLTEVLEHGDIDAIVEFKARADALRHYAQQKNLALDAQLAATEIVRRSERALGIAIKRGQVEGTVRVPGATIRRPGQHVVSDNMLTPTDVLPGSYERGDAYAMAQAPDERFDAALDEAKAEKNLSRANVVRKVKGEPAKSTSERPEILRRTRRIDANRVFQATVDQAAALSAAPELFDYSAVDADRIEEWVSSLSDSIRFLTTLKNRLKKELTSRD